MTKFLRHIKSLKTIYVPSLWFGILLVHFLYPKQSLSFFFGTIWGVLWITAFDWFIDK